jgi:hypothetical protein
MLMAYADGALEPAEQQAVEAILQRLPECQRKVETFRATLSPIQNLFRDATTIDHLGPLIDRIRRADVGLRPVASRGAEISRLPTSRLRPVVRHPQQPSFPVAIAASLALLIGGALGWLLQPGPMPASPTPGFIKVSEGSLSAQGPLARLLEKSPRGVGLAAELSGGKAWELEASFSFRSAGQQPCRRYELRSAAREHFAGYACRNGDGQWLVHAHAKLDAPQANPGGGFAPASGVATGDADRALEAAIGAASAGGAYTDAEERALIARGWTP